MNSTLFHPTKSGNFLLILLLAFSLPALSQNTGSTIDKDAAYMKVATERAGKISDALKLNDPVKSKRVQMIIAHQYRDLNSIHEQRKNGINTVKKQTGLSKADSDASIRKYEDEANAKLDQLHAAYLKKLLSELTPSQVEQVKDGMTYGVVPITYKGYLEMLPNLTEPQKKKILANLVEAREHAMDAESSEKKHAWFGKYKGRINNYLSAEGYDMNKASKEWQQRIREEEAKKAASH